MSNSHGVAANQASWAPQIICLCIYSACLSDKYSASLGWLLVLSIPVLSGLWRFFFEYASCTRLSLWWFCNVALLCFLPRRSQLRMNLVCCVAAVPARLTLWLIALLFMRTYLWSFCMVGSSMNVSTLVGNSAESLYLALWRSLYNVCIISWLLLPLVPWPGDCVLLGCEYLCFVAPRVPCMTWC